MNIVYILTRSDTVGGVQNHVVEIAARMIEKGHAVLVLCGGDGQYFEKLNLYGVPNLSITGLSNAISVRDDWIAYKQILEVLSDNRPDIVSTHSTKAGLIGRLACHKLNIPVIFTAHGWAYTNGVGSIKQRIYGKMELWLAKKTQHIVCVSEYDRQLAISIGISESVLTTVHNGRIDEYDHSLEVPENEVPVIVMIGRLDKQKDHETLFAALGKLHARYRFKVNLLGDGPNLAAYQSLVSELGLNYIVEFKGLVKDVHKQLRQADIFALVTHYEGFPRSTLEAMCAGLPVVVSNVGGSAEAVEQGQSGFVVGRQDVDGLVSAFKQLLDSSQLRREFGDRGRQLYVQCFSFDKMFGETELVYERVLSKARNL